MDREMNQRELIPLDRAYKVDEAIYTADNSIVIVRFGRHKEKSDGSDNNDKIIEQVDDILRSLTPENNVPIKVYTVEMKAVPELVARYNLGDPVTVLFFRNNIQGGQLQGDSIRKDEITKIVTDLATKQNKPREQTKTPTSNHTANNNNLTDPGWFKRWLQRRARNWVLRNRVPRNRLPSPPDPIDN